MSQVGAGLPMRKKPERVMGTSDPGVSDSSSLEWHRTRWEVCAPVCTEIKRVEGTDPTCSTHVVQW